MKITKSCNIANGEIVSVAFSDHGEVADLLNHLHDYYDLSWPKIAELPTINPPERRKIPIATLARIARTRVVPKKWRHRFRGIGPVDNRPRRAIHTENMKSAAETIWNQVDHEIIPELIDRLNKKLEESK